VADRKPVQKWLEEHILLSPQLNATMESGQCRNCFYVFRHNERPSDLSVPCPKCGNQEPRKLWPGDRYKNQIFPVLQKLYSQKDELGITVVVFSFAISKGHLRRCLHDALQKKGLEYETADQCVEVMSKTDKGTELIVQLHAEIAGSKSMSKLLGRTSHTRVMSDWLKTRTLRNKIAHGRQGKVTRDEVKRAFIVCVNFPSLIRYILNKI